MNGFEISGVTEKRRQLCLRFSFTTHDWGKELGYPKNWVVNRRAPSIPAIGAQFQPVTSASVFFEEHYEV
jgi:hypothetical protein